jgi:SPW repeat
MSPVARTKSASGLNVVLGCWLIVSPWIFGYSGNQDAMWNSIAAGIIVVVVLVAASRVYSPGGCPMVQSARELPAPRAPGIEDNEPASPSRLYSRCTLRFESSARRSKFRSHC